MNIPGPLRDKELRKGDHVLSCKHVNGDNCLSEELRTKFFVGGMTITFRDDDGSVQKSHVQALCWPCAQDFLKQLPPNSSCAVTGIDKFLENSFVWTADNDELDMKIKVA